MNQIILEDNLRHALFLEEVAMENHNSLIILKKQYEDSNVLCPKATDDQGFYYPQSVPRKKNNKARRNNV